MARLVDKTYGQALFDLSIEEAKIDEYAAEIKAIKDAFNDTPDLLTLLTHPQVSREDKLNVVENSFKAYISENVLGFLMIVIKAGRQSALLSIFDYFLNAVKAYKRIGIADVTSAVALTEQQQQAVKERLLTITDNVEYEINFQVDKSLIGGMIIRIGDKVVDSSIKTQLETMEKGLLGLQLS